MRLNDENKKQLKILKALSDPVRMKILKYLKDKDDWITCGEIGNDLNISKTNGSYHFKMLQEVNLINVKKQSREKFISLNSKALIAFASEFYKLL